MQGYLEDETQNDQQSCPLWSANPANANLIMGNSTRWWYVYEGAIGACGALTDTVVVRAVATARST